MGVFVESHDRAFAEGFVDLGEGAVECLFFLCFAGGDCVELEWFFGFGHDDCLSGLPHGASGVLGSNCSMWNTKAGYVRTVVVIATVACDRLDSTHSLAGVRGPARDRSVWCPYQTGHLPNVPARGGAVRGPDGATVPDPEQLVNVRGGFGGDNVWICWLGGKICLGRRRHDGAEDGSCI